MHPQGFLNASLPPPPPALIPMLPALSGVGTKWGPQAWLATPTPQAPGQLPGPSWAEDGACRQTLQVLVGAASWPQGPPHPHPWPRITWRPATAAPSASPLFITEGGHLGARGA